MDTDHELPLLAGIAGILRWLEELALIVSGPLLTLGLGIALVDLLTDGQLLTTQPELRYAWAVSQSVGGDAQLVGSAAKAGAAFRDHRYWQAAGYLLLVAALGYVAYIAALVFATQQAQGITTSGALGELGMDPTAWILQRSLLSVLLVILSGLLRYRRPKAASVADERAQLERELELEPLRQQVAARKALGAVGLGRQMLATAFAKDSRNITETPTPDRPPTGPGSPVSSPPVRTPATAAAERRASEGMITLVEPPEWRRRRPRKASVERRVRHLLASEPGLSAKQIAKRLRISDSTASKYRRLLESERIEPQQMAQ